MRIPLLLFAISLLTLGCQEETPLEPHVYSFRALSIPSENTLWAAASKGLVVRSTDSGASWDTVSVLGFEGEFRDIHAWDDQVAVVMGIASPGVVYKTLDGGQTWKEVYRQEHEATFFDQMEFTTDGNGLIWGDPIDGEWNIIGTNDFGDHWVQYQGKSMVADSGDVSFAASGSALIVNDSNFVSFTGGFGAKMHSYRPFFSAQIFEDTSSTIGAYSATSFGPHTYVFVGGDYRFEENTNYNCGRINLNGDQVEVQWPIHPPRGYRSCVITVDGSLLFACGPTGIDWSADGLNWYPYSDRGANVIAVTPEKSRIWAAGKGGIWEVSPPDSAKNGL